jgi:hypothetical protein
LVDGEPKGVAASIVSAYNAVLFAVPLLLFSMVWYWPLRSCWRALTRKKPYSPLHVDGEFDDYDATGTFIELTKFEQSRGMMAINAIKTITFYDGVAPLDAMRARLDLVGT